MVDVVISPSAATQILKLPLTIQRRIQVIIPRLAAWPDVSGAKPLRGALAGHYRVRTGDYRVQFHVSGNTLVIEKVAHRDGFYD